VLQLYYTMTNISQRFFADYLGLRTTFPSISNYCTIADTCPTATTINTECTCPGLIREDTHTSNRHMLSAMSSYTIPGFQQARCLWIGRLTWEWGEIILLKQKLTVER